MSGPFGFLGLNSGTMAGQSGPVAPLPSAGARHGAMPCHIGALPIPPHSLRDPATNNAPLVFNTNKGKPPMPISLNDDSDYRKILEGEAVLGGVSTALSAAENRTLAPPGAGMVPPGVMGMPPMGFSSMMPPPPPPAPHIGASDPNVVMMGPMGFNQFGQYMGGGGPGLGPGVTLSQDVPPREVIECKSSTLYPPPPGALPQTTRERPPGCRTVFVGGLPENCNEEFLREAFDNCGIMTSVRYSKKNFAHIRFEEEESVDKALFLSGYRMKIGNNDDKPNTGRLHVDFAQARDDLYEWECKQRALQREQRHRMRVEEERSRPPSPPPVCHFSDHEATAVLEKLKGDDTFMSAAQLLTTWLERGDCNRRTSNIFYSMVQSTNSHVRRLMSDRAQYDEDLRNVKEQFKQRLQAIIHQFEQIDSVFTAASKQKAWDHFTKAQRKNIELWRKQEKEIKSVQQQEFLKERHEDEMEMSDGEEVTMEPVSQPPHKKFRVDQDIGIASQQWQNLREENDTLKCQLEAYRNEVELIRAETTYASAGGVRGGEHQELLMCRKKVDDKEQQISVLQQTLQALQQQLLGFREKQQKQRHDQRKNPLSYDPKDNNMVESSSDVDIRTDVVTPSDSGHKAPSMRNTYKVDPRQARLIGVISTFLHVHPFGASIEYICSYLQRLELAIRASEMEEIMEDLPSVFKQSLHGVGASLEKRWIFTGFEKSSTLVC